MESGRIPQRGRISREMTRAASRPRRRRRPTDSPSQAEAPAVAPGQNGVVPAPCEGSSENGGGSLRTARHHTHSRPLPTGPLAGSARTALRDHAAAAVSKWFAAINLLDLVAHEALDAGDHRSAAAAASAAADHARRVFETAYGRSVNINMAIKSQEDVPDWKATLRGLPPELQAAYCAILDEDTRRILRGEATALPLPEARRMESETGPMGLSEQPPDGSPPAA